MILRFWNARSHRLRFPPRRHSLLVGFVSLVLVALLAGFEEGSPERSSKFLPLEFFREDITLSVGCSTSTLHGIYWFRNLLGRDAEHSFLYPFPVDDCVDYPDTVSLWMGEEGGLEPLPFQPMPGRDAVLVRLRLPADGVVRWVAQYRQRIHCPRARYILRTTGAWGQPLERADYRFELPASLRDVRCWPKADSLQVRGERRVLWSHRRGFLPERDMELWWSEED